MQVGDRLAGPVASVQNKAVAASDFAFAGELRGDELHPAQDCNVVLPGLRKTREMPAWGYENVGRRLRMDVLEGENLGVFIDHPGWLFFPPDSTE